jgi:RNA polymerase sigma-70 factor, ECF subfamily
VPIEDGILCRIPLESGKYLETRYNFATLMYPRTRAMASAPENLAQLLRDCLLSNSSDDWEAFLRGSYPTIRSAIGRTLHRWSEPRVDLVEDLTQEVFLSLCSKQGADLRAFRSDSPEALGAYLRTIATSITIDHLRAKAAQKRGKERENVPLDAVEELVPRSEGRTDSLGWRTLLIDIDKCMEANKDILARDRWVFWLYYRHGMTAKSIASVQGVNLSPKGVESLLLRVVRLVRHCFERTAA